MLNLAIFKPSFFLFFFYKIVRQSPIQRLKELCIYSYYLFCKWCCSDSLLKSQRQQQFEQHDAEGGGPCIRWSEVETP